MHLNVRLAIDLFLSMFNRVIGRVDNIHPFVRIVLMSENRKKNEMRQSNNKTVMKLNKKSNVTLEQIQ